MSEYDDESLGKNSKIISINLNQNNFFHIYSYLLDNFIPRLNSPNTYILMATQRLCI